MPLPTLTQGGSYVMPGLVLNSKSLDFDGTGDYLDLGNIPPLNNCPKLCIKAWVKLDNITSEQIIFSKTADSNNFIIFKVNTDGELEFQNKASGTLYKATSQSIGLAAGQWEHISFNYNYDGSDNAEKVKMSINGGSSNTLAFTGTWGTSLADCGSGSVFIGKEGSNYISGLINELAIWRSAVDVDELDAIDARQWLAHAKDKYIRNLALRNTKLDYTEEGSMLGWYRFGDGATDDTNTLEDHSMLATFKYSFSVNYPATIEGNPAYSSDIPSASDSSGGGG
jgi:hypothetical protein